MYSSEAFSSSHERFAAREHQRGLPLAALIALCVVSVCISLALPVGFSGWDDLHYVEAAQRWLSEGVNVPTDHWATRLPYVLTIAASLRVFGLSTLALTVPNTILFVIILLLLWHITRQAFGASAAFFAALVAATTPLYLRMPTTYYPEVMEIALAAGTTALTLSALRHPRGRAALFLVAGLVGGTGILVRQTELVMPIALSLLIVLVDRAQPRRVVSGILLLACGYAIPLALETLFYVAMTGDPLARFHIDSRHVLIPSTHMRGGTFKGGGSPLFNWALAARWDVPSVVQVHWTVNPLIRVFTSPGLLLTPWLCVAGVVAALRFRGLARAYAIFAAVGFILQYVLNTFVLVIAPDTRYLMASIALVMPAAGLLMSRLPRPALLFTAVFLMILPTLFAMSVEPSPAHLIPALKRFAARNEPIYVSGNLRNAATILLTRDPALAPHIRRFEDRSEIPVGGLAAVEPFGWTASDTAERCADGRQRWQPLETIDAGSGPWTALDESGLMRQLPAGFARRLQGRQEHLTLVRRAC